MTAVEPAETASELIHQTTSLCRECKDAVPAKVVARNGPDGSSVRTVWMEKHCPQHGAQEVMLSNSAEWYIRTRAIAPKRPGAAELPPAHPVDKGCPFDCGPCESHTQKVRLPVVTITSACNLDCPICYVHNKNEGAFHMEVPELDRVLSHLTRHAARAGSTLDIVNFTGGEPTLHPHFEEILAHAKAAGVHRVSMCTNGIRLARDEALVARLAALGVRIALSFDSFETEADYLMQGAHLVETKLRCLELLAKHDVDVTLIPVMTRGVNDHEIGRILELGFRYPNVRHIEVHTITYTGQSGVSFQRDGRTGRISMHEVLERIAETTQGLLRPDDFVPSPCAHPLCYQIAYLLVDAEGGPPIPLTRLIPKETVYECLADHLYIEPSRRLEEAIQEGVSALWASEDPSAQRALRVVRQLLDDVFPEGGRDRESALRALERSAKAVYVHSHMDEDNFDVERVAECCDSNCYADGSQIPVCTYNVLYREKEARFMKTPVPWGPRRGGQRSLPVVW